MIIPSALAKLHENNFLTGSGLEDREVLIRLYKATGGKSWTRDDGWGTKDNVGSWFGVCANDEGRVQTLNLQRNNLSGEGTKRLVSPDYSQFSDGSIPSTYLVSLTAVVVEQF